METSDQIKAVLRTLRDLKKRLNKYGITLSEIRHLMNMEVVHYENKLKRVLDDEERNRYKLQG